MRLLTNTLILTALCLPAALAQTAPKTLSLKDLPPAVQKTVGDTLNGGEIQSISMPGSKEEDGADGETNDGPGHRAEGKESKSISKEGKREEHGADGETNDGPGHYQIKAMVGGKHRAITVNAKGKLLAVGEETTIDSVPASVKAAILKKVGQGKLGMVETYTKPGQPMMYEAARKTKAGKSQAVVVKADGGELDD